MNAHLSYLEEENEELLETIKALNKYIKKIIFSAREEGYCPCDFCQWYDEDLEIIDTWGTSSGPCGCCDKNFTCWQIDERKVLNYELCEE